MNILCKLIFLKSKSLYNYSFSIYHFPEFAKEAMMNQSLDHDEILCLRWAHDDPNPVAQDAINRADRDALYALMTAKGISLESTGFEYPAEYSLPSTKKARLEDGTDITNQHPELAYPDTDEQFSTDPMMSASTSAISGEAPSMTPEEYAKYCEDYYINYLATQQTTIGDYGGDGEAESTSTENYSAVPRDTSISGTKGSDAAASEVWSKCVDEDTGAVYYFNEATQESSWGMPSTA